MLEGKKKFTAYLSGLATSIVGLLVTGGFIGESTGDSTLTLLAVVVPIAAATLYDWLQQKHDLAKEVTKQEAIKLETAKTVNGGAIPGSAAAEESTEPFDIKAFHKAVMAEVEGTYKEVNQATIYYKARDKGAVTKCQNSEQAQDWWSYLVDLANDARDYIKELTEKPKGSCGRSPEYYVFIRDYNSTIRAANALNEMVRQGIDWKRHLMPFQWNVYTIGILAEQITEHAQRR